MPSKLISIVLALATITATSTSSFVSSQYVAPTVEEEATPDRDAVKTCQDKLLNVCPSETALLGCYECAKANEGALREVGCTTNLVKALCQNLNNNNGSSDDDTGYNFPLPIPPTVLPPGTEERPLQVVIISGQSGCVGQASSIMLNADPNPSYDNVKGAQEGVWFAGFQGVSKGAGPERFYVGPMVAGEASPVQQRTFGPEVSLGSRIYEGTEGNSDVLVVKYCWGGSNLFQQWNPRTEENSWDRETDDGTARWLLEESGGATALGDKNHLYANLVYTVRRALEALDEGGIVYELAGFFWFQGSADKKKRTWKEYGDDSVALFEAVRADLEEPTLPIVDKLNSHHDINTGKIYAASAIQGCNAVVLQDGLGSSDPDSDCTTTASNVCPDSTYINYDVFNYFGWDPALDESEFSYMRPPGSSDKIFHWFRSFPNNQHAEYDSMIMRGRMMANLYIRSFTTYKLRSEWLLEDSSVLFPYTSCDPGVNDGNPNQDNICWMDLREEADLQKATCDVIPIDCEEIISISKASISGGSRVMPRFFFFPFR